MIFKYDELKKYVTEDFEDFYEMGFDKEQIYYAVLDEYKYGEDFCQVENMCIHIFLVLIYIKKKIEFNDIVEKIDQLMTEKFEKEIKHELGNDYIKYIADLNYIMDMR